MFSMQPACRGIVLVLLSLALASVAAPAPAAAQGCVHCSLCHAGDGDAGNVAFPGDDTAVHDVGAGTHMSCVNTGPCNERHPISLGCLRSEEQEEDAIEVVLAGVLEALADGDEAEAYRLVRRRPFNSRLYYLPHRSAIQAKACGDAVLVHLPLRSPEALALAAQNQDPQEQ